MCSKKALERFEVLKAMNTVMRYMNNEEAYFAWIVTIPDEADDEELMDIACNYTDIFREAVELFAEIFPAYYQDGGLYVAGKVY